MSPFAGRWEEADRQLRAQLAPFLGAEEGLVGVVHATQAKTFSAELFAVGVTADRLLVLPLDRKLQAKGDGPESVARADVRNSSVWGWGGGLQDFLSGRSNQEIRIETPVRTYKLMTLGGNMLENTMAGDGQLDGLEALVAFLQSSQSS
jgi:hypothetical protein